METKKNGRASACLSELTALHFPGLPLLQFSVLTDPSPNEQTTRQTHVITTLGS